MSELLPRVQALAAIARSYDIGFNIDAEEADRLELSLDLLQSLAEDPALDDWNGHGFVVQRPEAHTSELQSLMRLSSAVFCLKNITNFLLSMHRDINNIH